MSAATLREGDIVTYKPDRANYWCREGTAAVERQRDQLVALDTFWHGGDRHVLSEAELGTVEVQWNLGDYRLCERGERWLDYHPDDRRVFTSQHGLQRQEYVRPGATPDLPTRIENARDAVTRAESELRSAQWRLDMCRRDLDKLLALETGDDE